MLIPKFTADFRAQELERGRRSLWYFHVAHLGFDAWDVRRKKSTVADVHLDLAHFLEGRKPHYPWNRAVVCAARGLGKSVLTTQSYVWWRGLNIIDFSVKIVENSSSNAKMNHFAPMLDLFVSSRRADYLQWLYQHRIPSGFKGWNSEQVKLIQDDPLAAPFLTYWGLESRFEGWHGDLVVCDDPEGADAEKSLAANEESYAAYQKSIPLLKDHTQSQILIVATPHGSRPLVYRLRDRENWKTEADNATSAIKFFWREITDSSGKSRWPERFPDSVIRELAKEPMADQQYWLRRRRSAATIFDMQEILRKAYTWTEGSARTSITYETKEFDPDKISDEGMAQVSSKVVSIEMRKLRYFLHWDPLHRTLETRKSPMSKQRPAEAAIGVVGVAPDLHAFLIHYWTSATADLAAQAQELFRLYCLYAPHRVTFEGVGAQMWAKSFVETMEKQGQVWGRPHSLPLIIGARLPLPRLSTKMEEDSKGNQEKEFLFREALSPWLNHGVLHLRADQKEPLHQLEHCLDEDVACDIVDLLAQGPKVWSAPMQDYLGREFASRRGFVDAFVRGSLAAKTGGLGRRRWG